MRLTKTFVPCAVVIAACAAATPAQAARLASGTVTASGQQEIGGGDLDGTAAFRYSVRGDQLCYRLRTRNIEPAIMAHIHEAVAGVNGPVVIPLTAPSTGRSRGCVTPAPELLAELVAHPEEFYVNVHTPDFPGGAIRGQLG